jgi:hypothetical protein
MSSFKKLTGSLLLAAAVATTTWAVPTNYVIGSGSTVVANQDSENGLSIETSLASGLTGTSFVLNDGQSQTFDFFNIWTNETSVNISATLNFSDPLLGASVGGVTFGGWFFWGLGIADWGEVVWDTPAPIFSVGDRSFQLTLSDETFNAGPWGLSAGETYGATVKATVTQLSSSVAHVPDSGSTALLLGLALTGLGLAGYRRRA